MYATALSKNLSILKQERIVLSSIGFLLVMALFATPYMLIASFAYVLMLRGFQQRRQSRRSHVYYMYAAMLIDVILVLTLEVQRNAIATAIKFSLNPWQQAHIGASTLALLLYFPLLGLGLVRLKKPASSAALGRWHMRIGIVTFVCRTLGFLLMFSMLGHHGS